MSIKTFNDAVIYYWSGTGNSYRVASWISEILSQDGSNSEVISIDNSDPAEELKSSESTLVGLVFPTHGFTAPWHLLKFVWRLPRSKSIKSFVVATRAGLKFRSVYLPGISGSATFITALLLKLKGYNVSGTMSVDMPSNWFSLHPIQNNVKHEAIIDRAENKVSKFMQKLLDQQKVWFTLNNLYESIWGIILAIASFGYLLFGRFFLAKLFFTNNNCKSCGVCAKSCPTGSIKMFGNKDPKPYWKYNCESCMRCAAFCPTNCIEVGHSWGVLLYFITAIPVSAYIISSFSDLFLGFGEIEMKLASNILKLLYYFSSLFIAYLLFSILLKIPFVNWIFTRTTLTSLKFWGRYKEPNVKFKNLVNEK